MLSYDVREPLDIYEPRRAIRMLSSQLGFSRTDCEELVIVVSELTSNILKYGVRGTLQFDRVESADYGTGVLVVARDVGPPFRNLEMALRDGYDDGGPIDPGSLLKRKGLGTGLGAVLRLMDSFHVESLPEGKEIRSIRYIRRVNRTIYK